jgi:hypothetical protein
MNDIMNNKNTILKKHKEHIINVQDTAVKQVD